MNPGKRLSKEKEMNKIQQCLCDAPKVFSFNIKYEGDKKTIKLCARCRDDPDFVNDKDGVFLK